jgi:hypothetical protein
MHIPIVSILSEQDMMSDAAGPSVPPLLLCVEVKFVATHMLQDMQALLGKQRMYCRTQLCLFNR